MRNAKIDNARFVLITLVVLGHLLEPVKGGSASMEALYRFIYLFHMPAFSFLSGMLSSSTFDAKAGQRWLATLLLPYLVFQAIYLFVNASTQQMDFVYRVVTPFWLMWYLLSLAIWRLLLPAIMTLRWPIAVTVVVAVLVGLAPDVGYGLSLSRTFVFLPFFVAGHVLRDQMFSRNTAGEGAAALVVAIVAVSGLLVAAWLMRTWPQTWFYGSYGYESLKLPAWHGMINRAGYLLAGGIGCWAVLQLMPSREGLYAWAGRNSLTVYLLHGIIIKLLLAAGAFRALKAYPWLVIVIAPILVLLLACLGKPLRPVMDYRWLLANWLGGYHNTMSKK